MAEDPPGAESKTRQRARAVVGRATRQSRLGSSGERVAAHLLETRAYRILARNWRCPFGEIDLIAEDGAELVFVEVKTRWGRVLGAPEEAITPRKRRHLLAAAQTYLAEQGSEQRQYRFDVVAVELSADGRVESVRLHRRAFGEE
jgi:putative endonuclease